MPHIDYNTSKSFVRSDIDVWKIPQISTAEYASLHKRCVVEPSVYLAFGGNLDIIPCSGSSKLNNIHRAAVTLRSSWNFYKSIEVTESCVITEWLPNWFWSPLNNGEKCRELPAAKCGGWNCNPRCGQFPVRSRVIVGDGFDVDIEAMQGRNWLSATKFTVLSLSLMTWLEEEASITAIARGLRGCVCSPS